MKDMSDSFGAIKKAKRVYYMILGNLTFEAW